MSTSDPQFVSLREAARRLGVGIDMVREARDRGEFKAYRLGARRQIVDWREILQWVERSRVEDVCGLNRRPGTTEYTGAGLRRVPNGS